MAYNLQRTTTAFSSGKNILASEHVQFVEAGITLKAGTNFVIGDLIARDKTTGKFEKFANLSMANYDDFAILNVNADATSFDAIVGEAIVRGSVYEAKLPVHANLAEFKVKVPNIRFVKHV